MYFPLGGFAFLPVPQSGTTANFTPWYQYAWKRLTFGNTSFFVRILHTGSFGNRYCRSSFARYRPSLTPSKYNKSGFDAFFVFQRKITRREIKSVSTCKIYNNPLHLAYNGWPMLCCFYQMSFRGSYGTTRQIATQRSILCISKFSHKAFVFTLRKEFDAFLLSVYVL